MELKAAVLVIAMLCLRLSFPALSQTPPETTAPAPAPRYVDLADLLSLAGPYGTFLDYLIKTDVTKTFQSQANDTDQGVTIFAPEDSAFAAIDKSALSNLTDNQLRTLLMCHAMPKYYPLSAFSALARAGPVATFAGGQCTVNVTNAAGTIHIISTWATAKLVSSVYSTPPVAVYALNALLLPEQTFKTKPAVTPAPSPEPAPEAKPLDGAPSAAGHGATDTDKPKSLSSRVGAHHMLVSYLVLTAFGFLMI